MVKLQENGHLARLSFFLFQIGVTPNTARLNIFPEGDTYSSPGQRPCLYPHFYPPSAPT
jgi:hypothetical protein